MKESQEFGFRLEIEVKRRVCREPAGLSGFQFWPHLFSFRQLQQLYWRSLFLNKCNVHTFVYDRLHQDSLVL